MEGDTAPQVETQEVDWDDCAELVGEALHEQVSEELELVEMAGDEYTREGFLNGEISPVFWGSSHEQFWRRTTAGIT